MMINLRGPSELGALLLAANLVSCGGTAFTSSTGTKGPGTGPNGASDASSASSGADSDASSNGGVNGAGSDANGNGGPNGTDDAGVNGGTGNNSNAGSTAGLPNNSNASQNSCTSSTTPLNYNILFLFDDTGSQLQTDPTLVRRSGALQFLTTFTNYVKAYPSAQVNMNVMAFNTVAIPEGGWTMLNSVTATAIQLDITVATSNPTGDTAYSPAFIAANTAFAQINAQTASINARNYVIFLTDGLPDVDTTAAISTAVNNLVTQQDVAVIAIATGPAVPASGETTVEALALPATASKYPNHVGHYYRASTPADLNSVWNSLTAEVGACTTATASGSGTTATAAGGGLTVASTAASGTATSTKVGTAVTTATSK